MSLPSLQYIDMSGEVFSILFLKCQYLHSIKPVQFHIQIPDAVCKPQLQLEFDEVRCARLFAIQWSKRSFVIPILRHSKSLRLKSIQAKKNSVVL